MVFPFNVMLSTRISVATALVPIVTPSMDPPLISTVVTVPKSVQVPVRAPPPVTVNDQAKEVDPPATIKA